MGPESKTVIPIRGCLDSVRISVEKGDGIGHTARIGKFSLQGRCPPPCGYDRAHRHDGSLDGRLQLDAHRGDRATLGVGGRDRKNQLTESFRVFPINPSSSAQTYPLVGLWICVGIFEFYIGKCSARHLYGKYFVDVPGQNMWMPRI